MRAWSDVYCVYNIIVCSSCLLPSYLLYFRTWTASFCERLGGSILAFSNIRYHVIWYTQKNALHRRGFVVLWNRRTSLIIIYEHILYIVHCMYNILTAHHDVIQYTEGPHWSSKWAHILSVCTASSCALLTSQAITCAECVGRNLPLVFSDTRKVTLSWSVCFSFCFLLLLAIWTSGASEKFCALLASHKLNIGIE